MTRVLITGIRSPVAYDLARQFLAAGHTIAVCDCRRTILGQKIGAKFFLHASPVKDYSRFEKDAKSILEEFNPEIVIPMNEEVFYWSKLTNAFDFMLFAPPLKTLIKLHSKYSFNNICREIGLMVPKTQYLENAANDYSDKVLKREYSRFGESVYIKPLILPKIEHDPKNPYICQECIEGIDICFYAIAKDGAIVAFSCYFSDWRTKNGASFYFTPTNEETSQRAKLICGKIIEKLAINGQISFDLKQTQSGELYLIECNPRATSGLHIIGATPKETADAFLSGREIQASAKPKYILLAMLFYGLPKALSEAKFINWLKALKAGEDVFKGRNIQAFMDIILFQAAAILKGQTLTQYLTHDIECNRDLNEHE